MRWRFPSDAYCNLDELYAAGFRMMSRSHFTDTAVGGGRLGCQGHQRRTYCAGSRVGEANEARGMLIDLSHASAASLRDVTSLTTKPVIVSHTGVKGVCDNNPNLSDDQLRAVAAIGGGFWEVASCGTDAASIAKAIRYGVGVVGTQHDGLGSNSTEP